MHSEIKPQLVLPSLRGVLGDWVYYSSVMTSKQIFEWIKPAKDIREAKKLDDILQRDLKERKKVIARYLLKVDSRFFNSIIVGVFEGIPGWLEFDLSKAENLVHNASELEAIKDSIGLLVFNGDEKMFAIDGQHRVAGIQIAYEEDSKRKFENRVLEDDQFSVIFLAHIDDEKGRKRTRKLFSDINKNAKPVAQGDRIKIDEENLNAIVTRRIYANYKYFESGELISLTESAKLDNFDVTHFTNLLGIYNTSRVLKKLFKKEPGLHEWEEVNVLKFYDIVSGFFDFIIESVEDYRVYFIENKLTIKEARKNNSYLLYRPIGIKLLAGLYVHFSKSELGIVYLKENINQISFVFPKSPFVKVLWNNGKMEAKEINQRVALDLAIYILCDLPFQKVNNLLISYQELVKDPDAVLPKKIIPKVK